MKTDNHGKDQARAQLESIEEMVQNLLDDPDEDKEESTQTIHEDALSVEVRGDWHEPGDEQASRPIEYTILLCTGGPAVKIKGDLNEYLEPDTASLQFQDWFTPWEDYHLTSGQEGAVLTYARCFYFGA